MTSAYFLVIACGLLALAYGWFTSRQVLTANAGTARMQEISGAVQVGAKAYLNRQYRTIAIVGVVVLDHARGHPRTAGRDRLPDRGGAVGGCRLCRHERLGARQCEDRASRAQQSQGRSGDRLQGRRGHRLAGGRARSARGRDLLFHPARDIAGRRSAPGARSDGGAELWRVADLDFRPSRRRHLHQGGRCRRRPRRQSRGGNPGGRPAQPGRHRRQCRRQCRRLRRDGRRPVRDLCRDDRRDDAAGRDLFCAAAARQDADAAAGDRRGVHRDFGDRHVLRPARRRQRHHEGALQGAARDRDPVDRSDRAADLLAPRLFGCAADDHRRLGDRVGIVALRDRRSGGHRLHRVDYRILHRRPITGRCAALRGARPPATAQM